MTQTTAMQYCTTRRRSAIWYSDTWYHLL